LGQHEKAFDIVIHRLKDFTGAEQLCYLAKASDSSRSSLLLDLIHVYLKLPDPNWASKRIIALLNRHPRDIDALQVLPLLPQSWSVGALADYLSASLVQLEAKRNETLILKNLVKGMYIRLQTTGPIRQERLDGI
jgi:hypothetical protein